MRESGRPLELLLVRAGPLQFQQHITTLGNFLRSSGFKVTLVNLSSKAVAGRSPGLYPSVEFRSIQWTTGGPRVGEATSRLKAAFELRRLLRSFSFDVLYTIDSWTLPFLWAAGGFHVRNRRLVYHTFDMLEPGIHRRPYLYLERRVSRGADLVVNTDRARAHYQKSLYRLNKVPLYVRNSIPLGAQLPGRDETLRQSILGPGADPASLIFVYPSRASAERLTLEVIEAFALLPPKYRLFTITIDDAYGRRCRQLVQDKGLSERVVLSPPVSHDELTAICAAGDIGGIFHDPDCAFGNFMCNPDRLARFVALGVPFVASNVPNLESDVYRYGLGLCCDPFSPAEVASAVRALGEGRPSLEERRRNIRRVFEEELHYEKGAERLKQALLRLASN